MKTASQTIPPAAVESREATSAARVPIRPFYWSVRRELWENRSIYLAPLVVAVFAISGLVAHGITMPSHLPGMLAIDPESPSSARTTYAFATALMLLTSFVVGAFYCLEALNGERRDRSILFWKSLPVSDCTTVLSKASIPLLVLPPISFVAIVAMQLTMLLLSVAALRAHGASAAALLGEIQPLKLWPMLLYMQAAITLWHAPIYGFLLLVSGWARRTAVLWAVLPVLAAGVLEKIIFNTSRIGALVQHRLLGWYGEAFAAHAPGPEGMPLNLRASPTPGEFLTTPGLWIGLALAAAFIVMTIRIRRQREPL